MVHHRLERELDNHYSFECESKYRLMNNETKKKSFVLRVHLEPIEHLNEYPIVFDLNVQFRSLRQLLTFRRNALDEKISRLFLVPTNWRHSPN